MYMASLLKSTLAGEVDIFIVELMKDIMSIVMLYSWWCSISRTESDKSRFDQSMVET